LSTLRCQGDADAAGQLTTQAGESGNRNDPARDMEDRSDAAEASARNSVFDWPTDPPKQAIMSADKLKSPHGTGRVGPQFVVYPLAKSDTQGRPDTYA
jgi:hypothetical protein